MAKTLIIILILILATFLRFYHLENIPNGFYVDEAVQGYNSYSIAQTGQDEYGMRFPIFLRGLGTYGAPLYSHITTITIKFFGLSVFNIRLLSALSGVLIVYLTFLITKSRVSALMIAIAPWAIFLSRGVDEPNLGLVFLLTGIYFSLFSISKILLFPLAAVFLAISAYGYTAERVVSILFLFGFIFIFRKHFLRFKKTLFLSIILFFLLLLPQIILLTSTGSTIRLTGQSYFGQGNFTKEFFSQYLAYFSPRNLFFDPDPDLQRSIPELSVFYPWMIIPFIFGLGFLIKKRKDPIVKTIALLMLISPIPAALTKDPFSTFRTLPSFWVYSIIIGFGLKNCFQIIKTDFVKIALAGILIFISVFQLYSSYFVLFPYERAKNWDFAYQKLAAKVAEYKNSQFIIETSRGSPPHALLLFYTKYPPVLIQKTYGQKIINNYYSVSDFDRHYNFGNIETRPINFEKDIYQNLILVGDPLAISKNQAQDHKLILLFEIKDPKGEILLNGYLTNPQEKCRSINFKGCLSSPLTALPH